MVDIFAVAVTHALLLLAAWRLAGMMALDADAPPGEAPAPGAPPAAPPGERPLPRLQLPRTATHRRDHPDA